IRTSRRPYSSAPKPSRSSRPTARSTQAAVLRRPIVRGLRNDAPWRTGGTPAAPWNARIHVAAQRDDRVRPAHWLHPFDPDGAKVDEEHVAPHHLLPLQKGGRRFTCFRAFASGTPDRGPSNKGGNMHLRRVLCLVSTVTAAAVLAVGAAAASSGSSVQPSLA